MPRMRWRVVCALRDVMLTFWPTSRFSSVDLPTLGRPMMATMPVRNPSGTGAASGAGCSPPRSMASGNTDLRRARGFGGTVARLVVGLRRICCHRDRDLGCLGHRRVVGLAVLLRGSARIRDDARGLDGRRVLARL